VLAIGGLIGFVKGGANHTFEHTEIIVGKEG
jgi:hypothetical protein